MENLRPYEEQIVNEIRSLPREALPKLFRLLTLVRDEFLRPEQAQSPTPLSAPPSHEKTRQLLAVSKGNWAQDIIAEREDRL
ncbi:MAG: hypothetical protein HOP18_06515 [Deltaproteobacteria bacterium]|nr:hypothetical protein [Deltaproteobacteria bacterium]